MKKADNADFSASQHPSLTSSGNVSSAASMDGTSPPLTVRITPDIHVERGELVIGGQRINRFEIERQFPSGANGVVFAGMHRHLAEPRAIKIWLTQRPNDRRNKREQGIAEARAMAISHPEWVAKVHDAEVTQGYFWAAFELLDGQPLEDFVSPLRSKSELWWLARLYINAISATTTADAFHGDAHWRNVIVLEDRSGDEPNGFGLKLIDFGTSKVGAAVTRERHWRIVGETVSHLLGGFETFADVSQHINDLHSDLASSTKHQGEEYRTLMQIARFDDILNDLRPEAGLQWGNKDISRL